MTIAAPKFDKRLLGTWKSDKKRTFERINPALWKSPEKFEAYKKLFGRYVVRWTRKRVFGGFGGELDRGEPYELVAGDYTSVVVRTDCSFLGEGQTALAMIAFEEDCYWITTHALISPECFRRVSPSQRRSSSKKASSKSAAAAASKKPRKKSSR